MATNLNAARKRSSFHKRSAVNKQVSTQTEPYEDLFLSDDSNASSNEDQCTRLNTLINSNTKLLTTVTSVDDSMHQHYGSFDSNTLVSSKISESFDHTTATAGAATTPNSTNNPTNVNTQRNNRHRRYKKFSKRRKSLPSQGSSNEEPHPVTLIPRGPLICSNSENNWLPDRFSTGATSGGSLNYSSSINNCDYDTSSNMSICNNNNNNNQNNNNNNSSNLSSVNNTPLNSNNPIINSISMSSSSNNNSNTNLSVSLSTGLIGGGGSVSTVSTMPDSILKPSSLCLDSSPKTKIITKPKNKNTITFRSPIPSTVNYDVNIIKTTVYNNTSNSIKTSADLSAAAIGGCGSGGSNTPTTTSNVTPSTSLIANKKCRSRLESDFYLNDYIDDYQLDDEVIDTGTNSSLDEDNNDIILKLKEAEKVRAVLFN